MLRKGFQFLFSTGRQFDKGRSENLKFTDASITTELMQIHVTVALTVIGKSICHHYGNVNGEKFTYSVKILDMIVGGMGACNQTTVCIVCIK